MKRPMLSLLVLLLLLTPMVYAQEIAPQTRQEVIQLEGMDETVTTTYIESPRGYSMWIDTDILSLQPESEGNNMDVFLRPDIDDMSYEVSICYNSQLDYTFEQAIRDVLRTMTENYGFAEEFEADGTFTNLPAVGIYAMEGDTTILQYIVDASDGEYYVVVKFPNEAAEGFASRVIWMLRSFEVLPRD